MKLNLKKKKEPPKPAFRDGIGKLEWAYVIEGHLLISGWIAKKMNLEKVELLDSDLTVIGEQVAGYRTERLGSHNGVDLEVFKSSGFLLLLSLNALHSEVNLVKFTFDNGAERVLSFNLEVKNIESNLDVLTKVFSEEKAISQTKKTNKLSLFVLLAKQLFSTISLPSGVLNYGETISNPVGTLILDCPVSLDALRYQLATLRSIGIASNMEIILACPRVRFTAEQIQILDDLYFRFGVPITIYLPSERISRSVARNIAASKATTNNLIFLNPYYFPNDNNWFLLMMEKLDEGVGIVGSAVRFEDETIAHDGYIETFGRNELLATQNVGLPEWAVGERTGLISTNCIAIKRELFEQLGGFDPSVFNDQRSDADLCHKVLELGLEVYVDDRIRTISTDPLEASNYLIDLPDQLKHLSRELYRSRYEPAKC